MAWIETTPLAKFKSRIRLDDLSNFWSKPDARRPTGLTNYAPDGKLHNKTKKLLPIKEFGDWIPICLDASCVIKVWCIVLPIAIDSTVP